jgi:hypothetical protein
MTNIIKIENSIKNLQVKLAQTDIFINFLLSQSGDEMGY